MKFAMWKKKKEANRKAKINALIESLRVCRRLLRQQNSELDELRRRVFELEEEKAALLRAVKNKIEPLTIFRSNHQKEY